MTSKDSDVLVMFTIQWLVKMSIIVYVETSLVFHYITSIVR